MTGTLTNTGATLAVGTGTKLGATVLTGEIDGGTIADAGSGMTFNGGGVFGGVIYDGILSDTVTNRLIA